jgi:hypothetical protein
MACLISARQVLVLRMRPESHPKCAKEILIELGSVSHQNDEAAGGHTRQSFEEHFVGHFWLVRPVSSTSTGPLVLSLTVLCALRCASTRVVL